MPYIYTLNRRAMNYPYQLTSFDAYKEAYKKSIEDPAAFWADIASHFTWRKKWEKHWDEVKYCSEKCKRNKTK